MDLKRFVNLEDEGWWAGDLDVQRLPSELPLLDASRGDSLRAEHDLDQRQECLTAK